MAVESLAAALEQEHHDIDIGIDTFVAGLTGAVTRPEPLLRAIHALRRHIYLEEQFLFPALRRSGLVAPVIVMLREHGNIWTALDTLERELDSGASTAELLRSCRQLAVQLQHHNLKEEKILYPEADRALDASADAELRTFLDSGQMPDGWVCERARP